MYNLKFTSNFTEKYLVITSRNNSLIAKIDKTLELLKLNPKYTSLQSHKVYITKYGECFSSSVTGDIRIIWRYGQDDILTILLLDIGSHSGSKKVYI